MIPHESISQPEILLHPFIKLKPDEEELFTNPSIKLKLKNQTTHEAKTYDPQVTEGSHGYTRHTFPIKSKNLDSGTLIIEKDGEVIEVPFEYKYQKFWH